MSWIEDNAFDGYWPSERTAPLEFREYEWMQKDGKRIRLYMMTDSHLFNAYNKCGDEELQELLMKEMTYRLFEKRIKE
jgi:hypothetical protein